MDPELRVVVEQAGALRPPTDNEKKIAAFVWLYIAESGTIDGVLIIPGGLELLQEAAGVVAAYPQVTAALGCDTQTSSLGESHLRLEREHTCADSCIPPWDVIGARFSETVASVLRGKLNYRQFSEVTKDLIAAQDALQLRQYIRDRLSSSDADAILNTAATALTLVGLIAPTTAIGSIAGVIGAGLAVHAFLDDLAEAYVQHEVCRQWKLANCCSTCGEDCCAPDEACTHEMCCPVGNIVCALACVDARTDHQNCGECGKQCAPGERCDGGLCKPDPCQDVVCPAGATCEAGTCVCENGRGTCYDMCCFDHCAVDDDCYRVEHPSLYPNYCSTSPSAMRLTCNFCVPGDPQRVCPADFPECFPDTSLDMYSCR